MNLPSKSAHLKEKPSAHCPTDCPRQPPLLSPEQLQEPLNQGSCCLLSHAPPVQPSHCCLKAPIHANLTIYHPCLESFTDSVWPMSYRSLSQEFSMIWSIALFPALPPICLPCPRPVTQPDATMVLFWTHQFMKANDKHPLGFRTLTLGLSPLNWSIPDFAPMPSSPDSTFLPLGFQLGSHYGLLSLAFIVNLSGESRLSSNRLWPKIDVPVLESLFALDMNIIYQHLKTLWIQF